MADERIARLAHKAAEQQATINRGLAFAQSFVVDSQESYNNAFEIIRQGRALRDDLLADLDAIRGPLQQVIDYVEATTLPKIKAFEEVEKQIKSKAMAWSADQKRRLEAAAQAAQAALEAAKAVPVAWAAPPVFGSAPASVAAPPPFQAVAPHVALEAAIAAVSTAHVPTVQGVTVGDTYAYEVTNVDLLEAPFVTKTPVKSACLAYARQHKGDPSKSLPGLRIFKAPRMTVRS